MPVNTIVDDSGRDGPKRYAVREHSGAKYVQGGNPQPRNGKVIGHIIAHAYVPLEEKAEPIGGCKFFCVYGGRILPIRFRYVPSSVELID